MGGWRGSETQSELDCASISNKCEQAGEACPAEIARQLNAELKGDNYRLKFMQGGRVIWVDVDSATGRIVRRSGN